MSLCNSLNTSSVYYPFGVTIKERTFAAQHTRYQFNGKEYDSETETSDFGARNLDGDLGIWGALDPLAMKYPSLSPYNFVGNSPILLIDPDGEDIVNSRKLVVSNKTLIKKLKEFDLAVARISGKNVHSYKFVISGGDRYRNAEGKIFSATNNSPIPKSAKKSEHIQEEGASGIDIKFAEGISYDVLEKAAKEVGFRIDPSGKYDDHFHLDLKNHKEEFEYYAKDYVPKDDDFQHSSSDEVSSFPIGKAKSLLNLKNKENHSTSQESKESSIFEKIKNIVNNSITKVKQDFQKGTTGIDKSDNIN